MINKTLKKTNPRKPYKKALPGPGSGMPIPGAYGCTVTVKRIHGRARKRGGKKMVKRTIGKMKIAGSGVLGHHTKMEGWGRNLNEM